MYINETTGYEIVYQRGGCGILHKSISSASKLKCNALHDESLITFTSSSHGGDRPMAGYTILLGGTPIDWRAYRQTISPLSFRQGEYVSASTAAAATLGMRGIAKFFGIPDSTPTVIFCGDKAVVQLPDNDPSSKRTTPFATKVAFLREQTSNETVLLYHIKTKGQLANIFTKPLAAAVFHNLRKFFVKSRG